MGPHLHLECQLGGIFKYLKDGPLVVKRNAVLIVSILDLSIYKKLLGAPDLTARSKKVDTIPQPARPELTFDFRSGAQTLLASNK